MESWSEDKFYSPGIGLLHHAKGFGFYLGGSEGLLKEFKQSGGMFRIFFGKLCVVPSGEWMR